VFGSFEDLGLLLGPFVISAAYAGYGASSIFIVSERGHAGGTPILIHGVERRRPLTIGLANHEFGFDFSFFASASIFFLASSVSWMYKMIAFACPCPSPQSEL